MRPRVSLCMIVRNEAQNLSDCLAGLDELFHEIVVLDTGSTDNTRRIAESFGARVFGFPWCDDFSAARNQSRSKATGDWIFWIDADDRIDPENRGRLKRVLDGLPEQGQPGGDSVYVVTCRCSTTASNGHFDIAHARLFRNQSDLRWRGRIHEYLIHDSTGEMIDNREYVFTEVTIHHHGYGTAETHAAKQRRDQRLLEQEYLLHPNDVQVAFYLGRILAQQRQWEQAIPFLRRSVKNDPSVNQSATPKAASVLLSCLQELGRMSEAVEAADQFRAMFRNNFEVQYQCGMLYRVANRLADAKSCFRACIGLMSDGPAAINQARAGLAAGMDANAARVNLAVILHTEGQNDQAIQALREVVAVDPGCVNAWAMLGEIAHRSGQTGLAETAARSLGALPAGQLESSVLRSMIALSQSRYAESQRWARKAIGVRPDVAAGWITLGHALEGEAVDWDGCIAAFEKAITLMPEPGALLQRVQRLRMATAALRPVRLVDKAMTAQGSESNYVAELAASDPAGWTDAQAASGRSA